MNLIKQASVVSLDDFSSKRMALSGRIILTSGGFAPIHPGHQSLFIDAANLPINYATDTPYDRNIVVVLVNSDQFLINKHGYAFQDIEARCSIVSMCLGVDYVIPFNPTNVNDETVCEAIELIKPDIFAKGGDRVDKKSIPEWDICAQMRVDIITGLGLPKQWSSSNYISNYAKWRSQRFLKDKSD